MRTIERSGAGHRIHLAEIAISPVWDYFAPMDDLRISLSDPLQTFVDEQVATGDYSNAADYVAALIQAEAKARAQEKLEALLLEGLDSEETEWTEADWDDLRRRAAGG